MTQSVTELLQTFGLADLFDIALISIFIYIVLIWFKATASRFVLIGIIMLGIIYLITRFFNMYLSAVVLQAFFAILLIALVVIFQEELRRFFERLSTWGALRGRDVSLSKHTEIDTLTYALSELARKKRGALVVIRGKDPLDRHLEGGYELDGRLSEALLMSIFDPNSPGHDGAAVIEQGRVRRFGCHLPLSGTLQKTHILAGTRHSAALGLAERSDALSIALSEERGTISLARDEAMEELSEATEIKDALERFFYEKFPTGGEKTWRHWVKENSRGKALAVLVSCGLWFVFVFQSGTLRRDFVVAIEYRNLSSDWVIEEPVRKSATVTLVGRVRAFDLLDESALNVALDMSDIREGAQEVSLSRDMVRRPSSLSVVALAPEKVSLTAYQLLTFNLPVEAQTHGKVPNGIELVGIEVSPESVEIVVPSKFEGGSLKVATKPIDLGRILETTTLNLDLIIPEGADFADEKPPVAEVTIKVLTREEKTGTQ
jgi:uncharacterized protein (TIGR00159 family)